METINGINIHNPIKLNDYSVIVDFEVPENIKTYFNELRFYVEYDINISKVPNSILTIPLLSNILPIAWFNDVNVFIDEVDETFFQSIPKLKEAFTNMYPGLKLGSNLIAKKIQKNMAKDSGASAQLFSGGIDSLATTIRRGKEKPYLVTVWGADVRLDDIESWNKVKSYNQISANEFNTRVLFIKSNFRRVTNEVTLTKAFRNVIYGYHWWPGVQHSIALAGLCAPLTYQEGILNFYIPASYTADFKHPWGSAPSIDNNIKWANTKIIHESYDLSRQDKVNLIADYIKVNNSSLQIRVCWQLGHNGGNCNICEKCCRTVVGLLLEGIDVERHGFKIPENFSEHVRNNIIKNKWHFSEDEVFMWNDIQKNIPIKKQNINQCHDLFAWIENYEFKKCNLKFIDMLINDIRIILSKLLPKNFKKVIKKLIYST